MSLAAAVLAVAALLPSIASGETYATEWLTESTRPSNRINLVILGDGYTADADSQAKLTADASGLVRLILSTPPWSDLASIVTARLVHVISAESGATYGSAGAVRNTALGARYTRLGAGWLGIEIDARKALTVAAMHYPEYTFAFVIVNDTLPAGAGGDPVVVTADPRGHYAILHELGHSAGLADEYEAAYGYAPCDGSDCPEPNVTLHADRAKLKWSHWVGSDVPVPTPEQAGWNGIGLFEGARYQATGVYRPRDSGCLMRSASGAYCSVCTEAVMLALLGRIDLVDSTLPLAREVTAPACRPMAFSISPAPVPAPGAAGQLSYRWTVDGVAQADAGTSYTLPGDTPAGPHTVSVTAVLSTPRVRSDPARARAATVSWSVSVPGCSELSLVASASSVPPRGQLRLRAAGGSRAGYAFSIARNESGAVLGSDGRYLAGPVGDATDVVRVADSAGHVATYPVRVTAGLSVNPPAAAVRAGASMPFVASGGSGRIVEWRVTSASGGTVDASGRYTAGATGGVVDVVHVADSLGNTATATVAVEPAPPLSVSPASLKVARGGARTFTAAGGSGRGWTWALAENNSGGAIDPLTGAYRAGDTGGVADVVKVTDSVGTSAVAAVQVAPVPPLVIDQCPLGLGPGQSQQLAARGGSSSGYAWRLAGNGSGATLSDDGFYTAGTQRDALDVLEVTDSLGNSATATVRVGCGPYRRNFMVPAAATVPPRGALQFSIPAAEGEARDVSWLPLTFAVTDDWCTVTLAFGFGEGLTAASNSGGTLDSTGAYRAGDAGGVTDALYAGNFWEHWFGTVTVTPGVWISPAVVALAGGESQSFTAAGGSGTAYTWTLVANGSGGSVDPITGEYRAGAGTGTADEVRVTDSLGNSAVATVVILAPLVTEPGAVELPAAGTQAFTASGGSGAGLRWAIVANGSGSTIDPLTGVYTAGASGGTDVVRVTDSLGNAGSARVTVSAPPAAAADAGPHAAAPAASTPARPPQGGGCASGGGAATDALLLLALVGVLRRCAPAARRLTARARSSRSRA